MPAAGIVIYWGEPTMHTPLAILPAHARRRGLVLLLVASVLPALVLQAPPAGAVAPGANGRLACEGGRPDADGVMRPQVYTINPDGTDERILTDLPTRDGDPSWSPDGTKIAFESFRDDGSEVYVMNADGTGVTRLTFNGPPEDRGTNWSPDGSQIVFHSARFPAAVPGPGHSALEIFIMNADGSNQTRLTHNNFQDALADISPQGRIAFNSNRDLDHEIYDMNIDGSDQRRLTFSPGEDAHPSYSPDGSKIAFHSRRTGPLNIFVMDADGSNVQQITYNTTASGNHTYFPVWSPDGTKIAYTGLVGGVNNVYVMDADGSNVVQVTNSPGFDGRCDWGVASPETKDECKNDGWRRFNSPNNQRFRNQGQCVSWFNESQRNRL
jgi:Tol biopolymer transport system component